MEEDPYAETEPEPEPPSEQWAEVVLPSWRDRTTNPEPIAPERLDELAAVNQAAYDFWQHRAGYASSWVPNYIVEVGLEGHVTPAHAPPGFRTTLDHLRRQGFTDAQIVDAGLAKTASTGRLIDVFRDRLAVPIHDHHGRLAGFTARATNEELQERPNTPKWLNTPTTNLYTKSRTLVGLDAEAQERLRHGWLPVLCEAPFDALAIKASGAPVVPLALCGTAISANQLDLINQAAGTLDGLTAAIDQDNAGHRAAAKLSVLLGPDAATHARYATWIGANDPGDLIKTGRGDDLADALSPIHTTPLVAAYVEQTIASAPHETESEQIAIVEHVGAKLAGPGQDDTTITAVRELLAKRLPEVGWDILVSNLPNSPSYTGREPEHQGPAAEAPSIS
ncbi:MAG: toprim domain-containing protein [Promicromonosporaceae bacterium]|nr:toprim domain-containing protein [Promicromonosporaceae bacterium]